MILMATGCCVAFSMLQKKKKKKKKKGKKFKKNMEGKRLGEKKNMPFEDFTKGTFANSLELDVELFWISCQ